MYIKILSITRMTCKEGSNEERVDDRSAPKTITRACFLFFI